MFSGIITHQAPILDIANGRFTISHDGSEPLTIGQSIAHDGACMTLESVSNDSYTFFAMEETLKRTNFGSKKIGDTFNIETCVRVGDQIDGHFVTGHIDCVGTVSVVEPHGDESWKVCITFPAEHQHLVVEKGSIALNGISLTIVADRPQGDLHEVEVSIIPHTYTITNIGTWSVGESVNIEFDMIGKYIQKSLPTKNT